MMNLKKALKVAMASAEVNAKEFAVKSGVSESTISQTINGHTVPSSKTLSRLAEGLEISYSELIKLGE